jgi:hypothetical protein
MQSILGRATKITKYKEEIEEKEKLIRVIVEGQGAYI